MRPKVISTAVVVAAALTLMCSCADNAEPSATHPTTTKAPVADRGGIVAQQPLTPVDSAVPVPGARRATVTYRSTSGIDGSETQVSGTVFVPAGDPPPGGWPIVTVGHDTTGVDDDCAPSHYDNLRGSVRLVTPLLQRGFVVAVSDLQGLGTPGPHPYLEPKSAAYNLIDGVRAARAVVPDTSTRWAALGESQGGQASWAAAEHAADYGDGLDFLGSANLSPPADISPVIPAKGLPDLSLAQQVFMPFLIAGLQVSHPDLDPGAYLHGPLLDDRDILMACSPPKSDQKIGVGARLTEVDSEPRSTQDAIRMHQWLNDIALPKSRAAGPLLVVVGDNDNLIRPEWTRAAVERACALGDVVEFHDRVDEGHANPAAVPEAVEWVAARFAGTPAPNTCGQR